MGTIGISQGTHAFDGSVFVVDDDADVRESLGALLLSCGFVVQTFASATDFLASKASTQPHCCLIADVRMPDMDGLSLQNELSKRPVTLPVIIITGHGDVGLAVRAMKAGAVDFLEKPFDDESLLQSVRRVFDTTSERIAQARYSEDVERRLAQLTEREHEVMELVTLGHANKEVARILNISPRTVEIHRAHMMEKMAANSLADLVRMTLVRPVG